MKAILIVVFALFPRSAQNEIYDEERLAQALLKLPDNKLDHQAAAQLVAIIKTTPDLDPFILLAQLYIESRFDPTSTSRLVDGTRQTGSWMLRRAPARWSGNLYCGIAQSPASTWTACLALRETRAALAAQAAELRRWLQTTRGDLPRALAGYGCGNFGVSTGRCNRYPQRIAAWAKRLRRSTTDVPLS